MAQSTSELCGGLFRRRRLGSGGARGPGVPITASLRLSADEGKPRLTLVGGAGEPSGRGCKSTCRGGSPAPAMWMGGTSQSFVVGNQEDSSVRTRLALSRLFVALLPLPLLLAFPLPLPAPLRLPLLPPFPPFCAMTSGVMLSNRGARFSISAITDSFLVESALSRDVVGSRATSALSVFLTL